MKTNEKKFDTRSVLLGAVIGAGIMFSVAATTETSRKPVWEYKTVAAKAAGNHLGQAINAEISEGWEFVSASNYIEQWGFAVLRREKK